MAMHIQVETAGSAIRLMVRRNYTRGVFVSSEKLTVGLPCQEAWIWSRAERMERLPTERAYHVDRWTWRSAWFRDQHDTWALVSANGVSGMWLRHLRGLCVLEFELDEERNHPVRYASRCKRRWYPPSPRRRRNRRFRPAGATLVTTISFRRSPRWLAVPERLPEPWVAALVFTDHADQSAPGPLKALLCGSSEASVARPTGGFLGHGLHLTKTLFWRRGYEPQMSSPEVHHLVRLASGRGIEFGPHSATPYRDGRAATIEALKAFSGLGKTWIDHQPDTNCEAYSSRGWNPASPYFIADLFLRFGFPYVWTGYDVRPPGLNMLVPDRAWARPAILFPFHVAPGKPGRLWLWTSVWSYAGPRELDRRLSERALTRLSREHGILIAHTYLDDHHPRGHRRHRFANVLRRNGEWVLHPTFERLLGRLERFQKAQRLWVPNLAELADHLRNWATLTVRWTTPTTFHLSVRSGVLTGLRLRILSPPGRPLGGLAVTGPGRLVRRGDRLYLVLTRAAGPSATIQLEPGRASPAGGVRRRAGHTRRQARTARDGKPTGIEHHDRPKVGSNGFEER